MRYVIDVPFVMIRRFVVDAESPEEALTQLNAFNDDAYQEAYDYVQEVAYESGEQDEVWGPLEQFLADNPSSLLTIRGLRQSSDS